MCTATEALSLVSSETILWLLAFNYVLRPYLVAGQESLDLLSSVRSVFVIRRSLGSEKITFLTGRQTFSTVPWRILMSIGQSKGSIGSKARALITHNSLSCSNRWKLFLNENREGWRQRGGQQLPTGPPASGLGRADNPTRKAIVKNPRRSLGGKFWNIKSTLCRLQSWRRLPSKKR